MHREKYRKIEFVGLLTIAAPLLWWGICIPVREIISRLLNIAHRYAGFFGLSVPEPLMVGIAWLPMAAGAIATLAIVVMFGKVLSVMQHEVFGK